jgi:hypothetical protein
MVEYHVRILPSPISQVLKTAAVSSSVIPVSVTQGFSLDGYGINYDALKTTSERLSGAQGATSIRPEGLSYGAFYLILNALPRLVIPSCRSTA